MASLGAVKARYEIFENAEDIADEIINKLKAEYGTRFLEAKPRVRANFKAHLENPLFSAESDEDALLKLLMDLALVADDVVQLSFPNEPLLNEVLEILQAKGLVEFYTPVIQSEG